MRIYLDFDDALVGRMTFFHDYYTPILMASGSTQREIDVSYAYFERNKELFSPERQMEILGWREHKKEAALLEIENIIREHRAFIFPDVVETLQELRQRGHTLILLTYGDRGFQKQKITASGVAHLFDEIIITGEEKAEVLLRDTEGEPMVFVDDKVSILNKVKEALPAVSIFHICRKEARLESCSVCPAQYEIYNFQELLEYV